MMATVDNSRSTLLTIPPEIRERIYDYLFEDAALNFEIHPKHSIHYKDPPFWIHVPSECNIFLVCRQAYAETKHRPYAFDSIHFRGKMSARTFIKNTKPRRRNCIKHVSGIQLWNLQYKRTLLSFAKLETVHVGPIPGILRVRTIDDFELAMWDDMIYAVSHQNFDYIGPYGIEPLVKQGKYRKFTVDADLMVLPAIGERFWIPCTLDAISRFFIKHYEKISKWGPGGGPGLPAYSVSPKGSRIAEAEHETYEKDASSLRERYKGYLQE